MKTLHHLAGIFLLAATAGSFSPPAHAALGGPNGVVIPYAGKLELDGALVTGLVDFEFGVAPNATEAPEVLCRFLLRNISVTNGEFALSIVIPATLERCVRGKDVHLQIAVRRASISDPFIPLGTQRVTPVVAAATSGIGDFAVTEALTAKTASVTGALNAGSIVSANGNIGALTANTAAVTGALSAGTTTVGALNAGATTVTGNLVVTGGVSVGLIKRVCSPAVQAFCQCNPGEVAISGGGVCDGTKRISVSAPFGSDAWILNCDGGLPQTIIILCARLTP